jgi:pimeloyl-ACP methyl ester carboxylesterase
MTEFATAEDGIRIAYDGAGEGEPVLLIHGFASDRKQNWRAPGWYETLNGAGYKVIALDNRGHGESDKPHDVAHYGHDKMAADALAVMRAAGIETCLLMGYSMGGFIAMNLLLNHPENFRKVVIGGVGETYLTRAVGTADARHRDMIADALLVEDTGQIANAIGRRFRDFADQAGKDRLALAACMKADRNAYSKEQLSRSECPALVVCGENDDLTGPPGPLAAAFAHGRAVTVMKRDHMTTVGDKVYKQAVLDFFKECQRE